MNLEIKIKDFHQKNNYVEIQAIEVNQETDITIELEWTSPVSFDAQLHINGEFKDNETIGRGGIEDDTVVIEGIKFPKGINPNKVIRALARLIKKHLGSSPNSDD